MEKTADMLNAVAHKEVNVKTNVYEGLDSIPRMLQDTENGGLSGQTVVVVDDS